MSVHGVLAGVYPNRNRPRAGHRMLTHASIDGGVSALCGGVLPFNLCDMEEPEPPTCARCVSALVRAAMRDTATV